MGRLTKVVLDAVKPIKGPSIVDVSKELADAGGVGKVIIRVDEVDVGSITMTITIEGNDIDFDKVVDVLERLGVVIHSIDEAEAEP
ncbi:Uncharacterized protein-like protein [Ignicoccus hospitalis KIN4/I]|uniref:Uncharacterized protein-like protein n=1 Tax=Ignicoccus hospitalis (strain KIN4/I / DSM 18386 / JCM 14125) TaxID=453591 RepID=A8A9T6_IGNH4|nr:Uncharacterized protein-like protein [Ignicoccus hospitalis KIN4/I]HIH89805.1 DUF211 domain-containing protein [Desulfurococcaceae archaeon]